MTAQPVHILLIEDDPGDAEMIVRILKKELPDRQVLHLEDGAAAIDFIFGEGEYKDYGIRIPRVIILDLNMPKIDGGEVLQKIRSHEKTRAIPVVVLTSSREDSDLRKCYEHGVNSYVVKPVEFSNFNNTIKQIGHYWLELNQIAD